MTSRWLAAARSPLLACLAALVFAPGAGAHEVPADVTINLFVKPAGQQLELLVRVPMAAMQDVDVADPRPRLPRPVAR